MKKKWTKDDYLAWIKRRHSDPAMWNMADCRAADELIERTAIENFIKHVNFGDKPNRLVVEFAINMVRWHIGSADVDELLTKLRCYPDWMDK